MNEIREILKIAREMVAGVNIGIQGFNPLTLGEIEYSHVMPVVAKVLGKDWDIDLVSVDGGSSHNAYTGTINVYLPNEDDFRPVAQALRKVMGELEKKGIKIGFKKDRSRMYDRDVIRFEIRANPEAKYTKLGQHEINLTYSTWKQLLDLAGLGDKYDEQSGDAPVSEMRKAFRKLHSDDPKIDRFLDVVYNVISIAKRLGYKSISWG